MEPKQAKNSSDLLRTGVAAAIVGVHPQTLRNYEAAGHISATRTIGGERRFRRGDVENLRDNPPELYKRRSPRKISVQGSPDGFRTREPEQNPARLAVRSEPDLSLDGEPLSANGSTEGTPLGCDVSGQVAEGLLGDDLDGVGIGSVSGLGLKDEPVAADRRHVSLPEVCSLHGDVDVTASDLKVGAHGAEPTEAPVSASASAEAVAS